jgi:hypothetical protein
MNVYRRNFMKGALTGSTLLALGIPSTAMATASPDTSGRLRLLLGSGEADAEFAAGARTAFAARTHHATTDVAASTASDARSASSTLDVIKLKGGLLNEYEKVFHLIQTFRGSRWIAMMDDGSAAVFTELIRNAGGSLVLLGSHVSSGRVSKRESAKGIPGLRHVWAAASPAHAAGGLLAARLVGGQRSFSIVENFFSPGVTEDAEITDSFPPGFLAWRLDGPGSEPDPAYLYCTDVSPEAGCKLLGWHGNSKWTPVHREGELETTVSGNRKNTGNNLPQGEWVEAVGYTVTAAALGAGAFHERCSMRAHVYQSADARNRVFGRAGRFTSFVVDT